MYTRLAKVTLLVLIGFSVGADPQAPKDRKLKSAEAKQAIVKCSKEIEAAEIAYRRAVLKAKTDCLQDLKAAMKVAMRQSNLDEATQIKVEIDRLQAEVDLASNKLKTYKFQIPAKTMWNDTMKVIKGQRIKLQMAGQWSPGGPKVADIKTWPGRVRVGEGESITVNAPELVFKADSDGMMQIGIGDGNSQGTYNDNAGAMTVTVTLLPEDDAAPPANN